MSVIALLVLAAEGAAESSKVPFYLAGGLLATWAVIVSVIGLSRPEFPSTQGSARGVYAVTTVLVLIAATTTVLSS